MASAAPSEHSFSDAVISFLRFGTILLAIATLYVGQDVFIPVAMAILLSFVLAPVANALERLRLPRVASVLLIVSLVFAILGGVGLAVTNQMLELADSLPQYRSNITERFRLFEAGETSQLGKAANTISDIQQQVEKEAQQESPAGPAATPDSTQSTTAAGAPGALSSRGDQPVPVAIQEQAPSRFEAIGEVLTPALAPVFKAGLILVFVIFFLLQREDLRDRGIRLLGGRRLDLTTRALGEAGSRISRYLFMQMVLNVSYGIPVGIGLWLIGVPGAALWGLMATLLRFIPYLGPWLAAGIPILLSLAVFDGWTWPLAVIGLFVVLELFCNNVMEPWLYGTSTGMSAVGVLLAVVFWSALWGEVGLFVAIPLTVCLVVAGRHIPQLEIFTILFGREPALSPEMRLYQRLLTGDQEEAMEIGLSRAEQDGLLGAYQGVVIPALHLAERDRHADRLEPRHEQRIRDGVQQLIAELGERYGSGDLTAAEKDHAAVLCMPASDEADELAATMLAQILQTRGVRSEALAYEHLAGEMVARIDPGQPAVVCVSALPPQAVPHARYLCKQIKRRAESCRIVVGLWDVADNRERMEQRLLQAGADQVVTTYDDAVEKVRGEQRRLRPVNQGLHHSQPTAQEPTSQPATP